MQAGLAAEGAFLPKLILFKSIAVESGSDHCEGFSLIDSRSKIRVC